MNKNMSNLARFGLAMGIARLLTRQREGRVRRLIRRLGRHPSFTARVERQLAMLARRSSRRRGFLMGSLPLIGGRFGRRAPAGGMMLHLPVVAGLSLPALSALSLTGTALRNMSWMPGRRDGAAAQHDGRMMTVLMAPKAGMTRVTSVARNHRGLSLLGLVALGLAALAVFGQQMRARNSMSGERAGRDYGQGADYWAAGGSSTAEAPVMERTEAQRYAWTAQPEQAASVPQEWFELLPRFLAEQPRSAGKRGRAGGRRQRACAGARDAADGD